MEVFIPSTVLAVVEVIHARSKLSQTRSLRRNRPRELSLSAGHDTDHTTLGNVCASNHPNAVFLRVLAFLQDPSRVR